MHYETGQWAQISPFHEIDCQTAQPSKTQLYTSCVPAKGIMDLVKASEQRCSPYAAPIHYLTGHGRRQVLENENT